MATSALLRFSTRCSVLRASRAFQPASLMLRTTATPMSTKIVKDGEDFFDKNSRFKRPMSPHILIYRWPQTAVLSVLHRGTGTAYSLFISALGAGYMLTSPFMNFGDYITLIQSLNLPVWFLLSCKFILAWPPVYHTLNGIRHMIWDTGTGLTIGKLEATGLVVLGTSVLAAGALAAL